MQPRRSSDESIYEWSSAIESGDGEIDHQHQKIIGYLNDLKNALKTNDKAALDTIVKGLRQYAAEHFTYEESIMKSFAYDEASMHRRAHAAFITKIDTLSRNTAGYYDKWADLATFTYRWLISHITTIDRNMVAKRAGLFKVSFTDERSQQTSAVIEDAFHIAVGIEVKAAQLGAVAGPQRAQLRNDLMGASDRLMNMVSLVELRVEAYGCPANQLDRLKGIKAAIRTSALNLLAATARRLIRYGAPILSGEQGMPLAVEAVLKPEMERLGMMLSAAGGFDSLDDDLKEAVAHAKETVDKIFAREKSAIPELAGVR